MPLILCRSCSLCLAPLAAARLALADAAGSGAGSGGALGQVVDITLG